MIIFTYHVAAPDLNILLLFLFNPCHDHDALHLTATKGNNIMEYEYQLITTPEIDLVRDLIREKLLSIDINDNPAYFEALDDLLFNLTTERK